MVNRPRYKNGEERIIAVIGDEDTITGFLLAGVGDNDPRKSRGPNFFIAQKTTPLSDIEAAFNRFIARPDIGIILICQHIANDIRHLIAAVEDPLPCVLEIPSKELPYDNDKDVVLQKVNRALGIK